MKQIIVTCLSLLLALFGATAGRCGEIFPRHVYSSSVSSLECFIEDERGECVLRDYPIAMIEEVDRVVVSFDLLDPVPKRIYYRVSLCNAEWQPDDRLSEGEYLSGWTGGPEQMDESIPSEGTYTAYRHYRLEIGVDAPLSVRLSGNYLLTAWSEEDPEQPLFTVGFAYCERLVDISQRITPQTPKGNYSQYQAVECELRYDAALSSNPLGDLYTVVGQNGSSSYYNSYDRPSEISPGQLAYRGLSAATFRGGSEYRAFEILSEKVSNMGVERIAVDEVAHAYLYTDRPNPHNYLYQEDANGRRVVRNIDYEMADQDASTDYYRVTFSLLVDNPLAVGRPYIEGRAVDYLPIEARTLGYNADSGLFELTTLLKGGYVSYRYASNSGTIEGDYYQTENDYTTLVYLRSPLERHDRLVGVAATSGGF